MSQPNLLARLAGGMKLHTKLIAAFLALALIPVTVVSVYAYIYMRDSMLSRVEEGIASSIRQLQITADDKLQRYEQVLFYLMYDQQAVNIFNDESLAYYDVYYNMREVYLPLLTTIKQMNSDIERIGVYTDNPVLHPRGSEVLALEEARQSPLVLAAMESHGVEWEAEDGSLTAMGQMMRVSRHSPTNIAYLRVPAMKLLDYDPGDLDAWSIALADEDGLLCVQNHGGLESVPETGLPSGATTVTVDGVKLFVLRQPMAHSQWHIQFACPYDRLNIRLNSLVRMSALVIAGSLAVMAVSSLLVARSITRRVSRLNRAMAQVEAGTLTEKPTVRPWEKDEIAQLTAHFGNMLTSLEHHIEINYKNQLTLQEAEMKMLQAQINPHFLYNTLSMINWMALEHDEVEISEVLMQLSQFYRMILTFSDGEVAVRDEVENIMGYLELQGRLHEDSFDARLDVDEDILDCRMIGMVLQPIVENAIVHGLDLLRDRRGRLEVTGRRVGDELVFTIRDNGPGMTREQFEESLSRSSKGYGLKNVNDRLHIACGPEYGLVMPECVDGTVIEVRLPAREAEPGSAGEERKIIKGEEI